MSGLFASEEDDSLYFSRFDPDELLGSHAPFSFLLEDTHWPTLEHYVQAMQYRDPREQERVRQLPSPEMAYRAGKRWFKRRLPDWKRVRSVYLTRGVYIRCKTHDVVRTRLLDTGNRRLMENDQYDYYWGCGRDRRGENMYGLVLMNVREKLRSDAGETPAS